MTKVIIPELLFNHSEKIQTLFETLINMIHSAVLTLDEDIIEILVKTGFASLLCHYANDNVTESGKQVIHINSVLKYYKSVTVMTFDRYAQMNDISIAQIGTKAEKRKVVNRVNNAQASNSRRY